MRGKELMKSKKGFTLVELVAVVTIIGIIAAILVPKVASYVNEAKKVKIMNLGREVISAIESYNIKQDDTSKIISETDSWRVCDRVNSIREIRIFVVGDGATDAQFNEKLGPLVEMKVSELYRIVNYNEDFKIKNGKFDGMLSP